MRRLGALILTLAVAVIVGFAAFYGFVHRPSDGGRVVQVLYAGTLLLPPALFLALALALLLRQATGSNVLALVAVAVVVGSPTLIYFLGALVGAVLAAAALSLIGVAVFTKSRRTATGWPPGRATPG